MKRLNLLLIIVLLTGVFSVSAQDAGTGPLITVENAASVSEIAELEGHEGAVNAVTFSPDGTLVASGGDDATVHLWDPTTGEEILTFSEHRGAVNAVIFSPDGATIASAGFDLTVLLWDAATGVVDTNVGLVLTPDQVDFVHSFTSDTLSIRGLTWLDTIPMFVGDAGIMTSEDTVSIQPEEPDILSVARTAGSLNSSIAAMGMSTGLRVSGHGVMGEGNANIPVLSVAFAPNAPLLATGDASHMVKLWNVENIAALEPFATLEGHSDDVTGVAFSPDGAILVSSSLDGSIRLWNVETSEELAVFESGDGVGLHAVAFSPDGSLIATAGSDGMVRLWGVAGEGGSEEAQAPEADDEAVSNSLPPLNTDLGTLQVSSIDLPGEWPEGCASSSPGCSHAISGYKLVVVYFQAVDEAGQPRELASGSSDTWCGLDFSSVLLESEDSTLSGPEWIGCIPMYLLFAVPESTDTVLLHWPDSADTLLTLQSN